MARECAISRRRHERNHDEARRWAGFAGCSRREPATDRGVAAENADGSHREWRYALAHNMNEIPAVRRGCDGLSTGVSAP
jgi:hypothetical protein